MSFCPQCKTNEGPHYVPPSCNDPGFYLCMSEDALIEYLRKEYKERIVHYSPGSLRWIGAKAWLDAHPEGES
jgi:hypothetical protein